MRSHTLNQWDSDSGEDAPPSAGRGPARRLAPKEARAADLLAAGLVPVPRGATPVAAEGLVLVTADYGEPVAAITSARGVLSQLRRLLAPDRVPVKEVNVTSAPEEEAARYNAAMFPTFYVSAAEGLYRFQGRISAPALAAAARKFRWVEDPVAQRPKTIAAPWAKQ
jgi:hypothetical protein